MLSKLLCQIPILSFFVIPSLSFVILPQAAVFSESVTPSSQPPLRPTQDEYAKDPIPVVIWHGLGDSADNPGLKDVATLIESINPGTFVHIVSVGEIGADRKASWFGNVTEQVQTVCESLASDPILSTAPAIDAVGFSQGGQFLRGYIERCGHWAPKVRSLITFGGQHNGIAEFQSCKGPTDFVCHAANALLKGSTVWSDFVQSHLVPAQYYRDVKDYDNYLAHSNFLADINNERAVKNTTYKENLSQLENFVMVLFEDDTVVIPKESGWFAEVEFTEDNKRNVTKLQDRPIYKEDWLGLKALDEKGALVFDTVKGGHMQLNDKDLKRLFKQYFGPLGKKPSKSRTEAVSWEDEL